MAKIDFLADDVCWEAIKGVYEKAKTLVDEASHHNYLSLPPVAW